MKNHSSLVSSQVELSTSAPDAARGSDHLLSKALAMLNRHADSLTNAEQQRAAEGTAHWLSPKARARGSSLAIKNPTDRPVMF